MFHNSVGYKQRWMRQFHSSDLVSFFFPIKRNNVNLSYVDPHPNTLDHNKWCRLHPHKNTPTHTHTEHGLTLAWNQNDQGWFRTRCRPLGSISRGNSEKMCTPWFSSPRICPRILFFYSIQIKNRIHPEKLESMQRLILSKWINNSHKQQSNHRNRNRFLLFFQHQI